MIPDAVDPNNYSYPSFDLFCIHIESETVETITRYAKVIFSAVCGVGFFVFHPNVSLGGFIVGVILSEHVFEIAQDIAFLWKEHYVIVPISLVGAIMFFLPTVFHITTFSACSYLGANARQYANKLRISNTPNLSANTSALSTPSANPPRKDR